MTGAIVGDVIGLIFLAAIVYVLVRPDSKAAQLVQAVTDMMSSLISTATGFGR